MWHAVVDAELARLRITRRNLPSYTYISGAPLPPPFRTLFHRPAPTTTCSMSTPYVYHPLPPASKCIRVLDIIPASAPDAYIDTVHIEGRLRVIDLAEQPAFTALSYVWGAYAPTPHQILCDGVRVAVTSNCHSALRHLRRKLGHFTIWVDAICIIKMISRRRSSRYR